MKTVLVAVDLSQHPERLLARAAQLANQHQSAVTVLHVMEGLPQGETAAQDAMQKHILMMLEGFIATAGFHDTPQVCIERGVPHLCITRTARDLAADVILIGPGDPASVVERVFGSTADRIVRTASAPVLIVRNAAEQAYRHTAVAVDFSALSPIALDAARALAPDAAHDLVHVCEIPLQFEQAMLRVGTPAAQVERYRQARLSDSRRQLSEFARLHDHRGKTAVLAGTPATVLVELSRGGGVELLALGSQGRNAVAQALVGSVARRLLSHSGCDILLVGSQRARD